MQDLDFIEQNFLHPPLQPETLDVYVVRRALVAAVAECMPALRGRLLDVGCGRMPYRRLILEKNKQITEYLGLDLERTASEGNGVADLYWNGQRIPLSDNSVESAMATEVLEHAFEPAKTLAEINRVLRPGGVFLFTVPFLWPLHEVPYDAYRYTPFSLNMHLAQSGFENISVKSLGGWHASFAQMLGLWAKESSLTGYRRKLAVGVAKRLIPYLLKIDRRDNGFGQHCMVAGLYGTATKKQNP